MTQMTRLRDGSNESVEYDRRCSCARYHLIGPVLVPDPDCHAYLLHVLTDRPPPAGTPVLTDDR